jgi:arsenical pump membrane protein
MAAAVVALGSRSISFGLAADGLSRLRGPLLLLVFAVPLAVLLDGIGFFATLAALADGHRWLHAELWALGTVVVVAFNLDAAVVLLTPLYVQVARRRGLDPLVLGVQPALLACLASGFLPVSNLTNLLAAERLDLDAADFVVHLGLPTVAAVVVGWIGYWLVLGRADHASSAPHPARPPVDRRALRRGGPVVALTLVGFTLGDHVGVPAWAVAAAATALVAVPARRAPWRAIPMAPILLTAALGVLVAGAVPHLGVEALLDGRGPSGQLRAFAFATAGSLGTNNLPAALAGVGALGERDQVWPLLVLTASLSSLLWRDTAAKLDVHLSPARFSWIGLRVGGPATLAALAVVMLGHAG